MRVRRANHTKAIGITFALRRHFEAAQIGLAYIRAVGLAFDPCPDTKRHSFEIGKFIIWREQWVGFAIAFYLRHFHNRLIAHTGFGIIRIHRAAVPFFGHEHQAVGTVGIMRHGNCIHAFAAQAVHPCP